MEFQNRKKAIEIEAEEQQIRAEAEAKRAEAEAVLRLARLRTQRELQQLQMEKDLADIEEEDSLYGAWSNGSSGEEPDPRIRHGDGTNQASVSDWLNTDMSDPVPSQYTQPPRPTPDSQPQQPPLSVPTTQVQQQKQTPAFQMSQPSQPPRVPEFQMQRTQPPCRSQIQIPQHSQFENRDWDPPPRVRVSAFVRSSSFQRR